MESSREESWFGAVDACRVVHLRECGCVEISTLRSLFAQFKMKK